MLYKGASVQSYLRLCCSLVWYIYFLHPNFQYYVVSVSEQAGDSVTLSQTPKTSFLVTWLMITNISVPYSQAMLPMSSNLAIWRRSLTCVISQKIWWNLRQNQDNRTYRKYGGIYVKIKIIDHTENMVEFTWKWRRNLCQNQDYRLHTESMVEFTSKSRLSTSYRKQQHPEGKFY